MKRLVVVAIMVAFLLGTVGAAQATKIEATGDWQMSTNYVANPNFNKDLKDDRFQATQRLRTQFNFVANENLKGVFRFHVENRWGELNRGVGVSRNQVGQDTIGYDLAYIDFMIPNSQVNIKTGKQLITLPGTLGSHIMDDYGYSVVLSAPFSDMVGLTAGWVRAQDILAGGVDTTGDGNIDDYNKDELDVFFAVLPVTLDGMQFNPFVAYARAGEGASVDLASYPARNDYKRQNTYWIGLNAAVDMFDPIVIMGDFNYGYANRFYNGLDPLGNDASSAGETAGWIAALAVQYNMDMFTPMIYGLYESGESRSSAGDDSKGKIMPTISGDLYGLSSFGAGGTQFRGLGRNRLNVAQAGAPFGATGKWGVGLKLKDISFMEKLTHEFQLVYYRGTNHKDLRDGNAHFTSKDYAWETNFNTSYQMYENLAAILELGYMNVNLSDGATGSLGEDRDTDAAWKAAAGVRYRF